MKTALLALVVVLSISAVADAGIFKKGQRYLLPWRRPDVTADEPPPDNPAPFVDSSLVEPSPEQARIDAAIAKVEKLIEAVNARPIPEPPPEPKAVASPPSQPLNGLPVWLLPALTGLVGGGLGLRSALGDKSSGGS